MDIIICNNDDDSTYKPQFNAAVKLKTKMMLQKFTYIYKLSCRYVNIMWEFYGVTYYIGFWYMLYLLVKYLTFKVLVERTFCTFVTAHTHHYRSSYHE